VNLKYLLLLGCLGTATAVSGIACRPSGPAGSRPVAKKAAEPVSERETAAINKLLSLADTEHSKSQLVTRDDAGHVVAVDLTGTPAKDDDLGVLADFPDLERAKLGTPDITDAGMKHVAVLKKLRWLDLEASAVGDDGIAALAGLESVEDISLKRTGIGDAAFAALARMPNVKHIRAAQTYVSDAGLEHLKGKANLVVLDLRDCPTISDAGLAHLAGLSKLRDLKVWGSQITSAGMEAIGKLTGLRVLSLQDTAVSDDGMAKLKNCGQLEQLILMRSPVGNEGMATVGTFQKLRILDLRGTSVSDEGMKQLAQLENLQELDLSETIVGNDGLAHLKGLPKLVDLNLWAARVGDAGMVHVGAMTQLKRLNLDNVRFPGDNVFLTDEGLKQLAGLKDLEWLHVGKTEITDAGLKQLAGFKKLKHLEVTVFDKVTPAGVAELKKALPGLEVVE
jgi:hypothetical protein